MAIPFLIYARFNHPEYGWPGEGKEAQEYLEVGKPYRVVHLHNTAGWRTDIILEGLEAHGFNSVLFDFEDPVYNPIPFRTLCDDSRFEDYWARYIT